MEDLKDFILKQLNPLNEKIENLTKEVAETKQSVMNTEEVMNLAINAKTIAEEAKKEIAKFDQKTNALNTKFLSDNNFLGPTYVSPTLY